MKRLLLFAAALMLSLSLGAQELANFCAYVNTKTAGDAYYGKYVVLCSDIVLNENLLNALFHGGVFTCSGYGSFEVVEYGENLNCALVYLRAKSLRY